MVKTHYGVYMVQIVWYQMHSMAARVKLEMEVRLGVSADNAPLPDGLDNLAVARNGCNAR